MAKRTFGDAVKAADAANPRGGQRSDDAPIGTYTATCVFTDVKQTNSGDKWRLILRYLVDSGPHTGKGGWNSQTLDPTSDVSLRIFGNLCKSLGIDPETELTAFDIDNPEDIPRALEYVASKAKGVRNEIKVMESRNSTPEKPQVEIKYVNPLPKNAAPAQKAQAAAGMAQVAAASNKPAAPKRPTATKRPAL